MRVDSTQDSQWTRGTYRTEQLRPPGNQRSRVASCS
ncbi:hypothetical protein XOCgx_0425 [Xanthomonas oryzae pv. oryzicola]|nr:hypothetical protein XOCgx_0425 [Xanthomonas oryzae pv. oryzicola]